MFVNLPGVANFRALRVEAGDQHLYWQPTYQHLLRVEGAFGEFFPQAEFADGGNQVIFTKYVDNVEVLSRTRALRPGERIPRVEWRRFMETWANFKRLGDRTDIPEDVRSFIQKFGPPSVERYPAAYRIYRPHWYSKSRLFILWGLEPVGGAEFVSLTPEQAIQEASDRVETDGQEAGGNFLRWLKVLFIVLLALGLFLLVLWLCLPRPKADFVVSAQAEKPAAVENRTKLDRDFIWGVTSYAWNFEDAVPAASIETTPAPLWKSPGTRTASLEATQSTLWGLLYKSDVRRQSVTVAESDKALEQTGTRPSVGSSSATDSGKQTTHGGGKNTPRNADLRGANGTKGADKGEATAAVNKDEKMPAGKDEVRTLADKDSVSQAGEGRSAGVASNGAAGSDRMGSDAKPGPKNGEGEKSAHAVQKSGMSKDDAAKGGNSAIPAPPAKGASDNASGANTSSQRSASSSSAMTEGKGADTADAGKDPARSPAANSSGGKPTDGTGLNMSDNPSDPSVGSDKPMPSGGRAEKANDEADKNAQGKGTKGSAANKADKNQGSSRTLPVPSVQIRDITVLPGGDTQDIDFELNLPAGVRVERLSVNGQPVTVSPGLRFRVRLPVGPHSVRIEYGSPKGDLHGEVTQDVVVDRDEVRIIKPRTRIAPPVQVPGADQPSPEPKVPGKARDEAAEKFDKKIA